MMKECNVLISGVGGQGTVLMGELLGKAAVNDGLSVKGLEMIGTAQRGAPVTSMLRLGGACRAPIIPLGRGDIMIGLEPGEALRNITYMSKAGIIILNTQRVTPVMTMLGMGGSYASTEEIVKKLKENSSRTIILDAIALAEKAGSGRSANMVMLGAAFGPGLLPIRIETIKTTMGTRFRKEEGLFNLRAFELGYQAWQQSSE